MNVFRIRTFIVFIVFYLHLDTSIAGKKNNEEIIVINNTGGGGCGGGAKTIVKTDGGKKNKKGGGHKIILMAGGGGGKCGDKHHHTKVVHVPVPVPVPVPVKHEVHHEKQDHWGGHHEDHWASASSHDEIKPRYSSKSKSNEMISSATIAHHPLNPFNFGHMMPRMEKHQETKSNLLKTLLNSEKSPNSSNRSDIKKSANTKISSNESNKKKNENKDKNFKKSQTEKNFIDSNNPTMINSPLGFSVINEGNPNFFSNLPMIADQIPMPSQQLNSQQMHDAYQQQMQMHQFEQHMQNQMHNKHLQQQQMQDQINFQKMQEAMSSNAPQQLSQSLPLTAQLPIPLPGQVISAPVFEPINQQSNPSNSKNQIQELEIIPYEVQQQLHLAAQQYPSQFKKENSSKDLSKENREKSKLHENKDIPLELSSSNLIESFVQPNQMFSDFFMPSSLHQMMMMNNKKDNFKADTNFPKKSSEKNHYNQKL